MRLLTQYRKNQKLIKKNRKQKMRRVSKKSQKKIAIEDLEKEVLRMTEKINQLRGQETGLFNIHFLLFFYFKFYSDREKLKRKMNENDNSDEARQRFKQTKPRINITEEALDLREYFHSDNESNNEEVKNSKDDYGELKALKCYQKEDNGEKEIIYFQYSDFSQGSSTAYYKCLSKDCGGRAKCSFSKDGKKIKIDPLKITKDCTIKYDDHKWRSEKKYFDAFEVTD